MPDRSTIERVARLLYNKWRFSAPEWTDENLPDNETVEEARDVAEFLSNAGLLTSVRDEDGKHVCAKHGPHDTATCPACCGEDTG